MINFSRKPKRCFVAGEEITGSIRESNNFDPDEGIEEAGGFLLFEGDNKRVWLIATSLRLYSIVDDRTKKEPRIEWSISRSRLYTKSSITLKVRINKAGKNLVDIGYRKACAFTPRLFTDITLKERIHALLREKMG